MKLSFKYIQNYFLKNVDFIAFVKLKKPLGFLRILLHLKQLNLQKTEFFVEKCSVYRYWPC